ncbi:MAG: hypothetical protein Q7R31_03765 [Candidatus Levybacteria bacterium]|nr:hypothetical protein [Candidatus Levybacteria bacterium]
MEENKSATQPIQNSPEIPNNATVPPTGFSKTRLYILGGLGVLILILIGYLVTQKSRSTTQTQQVIAQPAVQPKPTLPRSKAPGIIISVVTAKGIDLKTGEAIKPTATFLTTDKNIYAVTTLQNAKVGTRIEYVRYLNNKFLDNRSIKITKSNTNNTSFVWTLKNSTSIRPVGQYKVKVYTNGIFEKEISYQVQ